MRVRVVWGLMAAIVVVGTGVFPACTNGEGMPFGGPEEVEFAEALWAAMGGYQGWLMKSDYTPGGSPHGDFVRLYYNMVSVGETPYHVIVKDNFGGEGSTLAALPEEADTRLMAVTVMAQREAGYDEENGNWFWAKYDADGTVSANDQGVVLAGRVAKGSTMGCIACHANAQGGDYLFTNDR